MFENVKFGDRFLLRDGSLALYIKSQKAPREIEYLYIFDKTQESAVGVLPYKPNGICPEHTPYYDVIKKVIEFSI